MFAKQTVKNLTSYRLNVLTTLKKSAFTLAEVLITIGIIGVVAAITMPTLISNYQKKQTVTRLEKAYTVLSQAVKMSELDNDTVDNWSYTLPTDKFYNLYLKNYLKLTEANKNNKIKNFPQYKKLNGQSANSLYTLRVQSFRGMLLDGTFVFISFNQDTDYKVIAVDINGFAKPNTLGKDAFYFAIQPKYGVTPFGFGVSGKSTGEGFGLDYKKSVITGTHSTSCNKKSAGSWCTALIFLDNWEITKDYPW